MNRREMRRHFTAPVPTTITSEESAALGRMAHGILKVTAQDLTTINLMKKRLPPAAAPRQRKRVG